MNFGERKECCARGDAEDFFRAIEELYLQRFLESVLSLGLTHLVNGGRWLNEETNDDLLRRTDVPMTGCRKSPLCFRGERSAVHRPQPV